jgi:hypothetical protein
VTVYFDLKGGEMKCHALIDENGKRCEYVIDKDGTFVLSDPIGSGMASRIYHQVYGGGNSISVVTSFTILPKQFEEVTKLCVPMLIQKRKKPVSLTINHIFFYQPIQILIISLSRNL